MTIRRVPVELGDRSYVVAIAADGFAGLRAAFDDALPGAERAVLVSESRVAPLWAGAVGEALGELELSTVLLPAGEAHKDVGQWSRCVDALLEAGVDRRTPVLALGGGVLGDVAGFAAATTLRGLPLVQLPTTLLAMVDSAVGGKTAVNHPSGKNLIGAFHQPSLVYASLPTLDTLDPAERAAGLGEVVKTALLGDAALFRWLEEHAGAVAEGRHDALAHVVARCVAVKARIVARDEREGGVRAVLNLGHTVGHGLETALGHGALRHGAAVAIGLVVEARWAVREGLCADRELPDRVARLLDRLGLPSALPTADPEAVVAAMQLDKKTRGDKLSLPVPTGIGSATVTSVSVHRLPELLT